MGHVYYSQYLVWFEIGRTDLLRQLGTTYRSWEDDKGIFLPVRECRIKYMIPAQYDDIIIIETHLARLTKASVDFDYRLIRQSNNDLLAEGTTSHAFVDASGKIRRVAQDLMPQFFT